jgi:hypothetical protein
VTGSTVRVGSILAQRHQEDGILLTDAEVHSLLQRRLLLRHDIVVADDVVDFHAVDLIKRAALLGSRALSSARTHAQERCADE